MKTIFRISRIILIGFGLIGCLDPYSPPTSRSGANLLVVDGFINASDNVATVKLTRTVNLSASSLYPRVTNATVTIEDNTGLSLAVPEISQGVYTLSYAFNDALQYRVRVLVEDGNYVSDYVPIEKTPIIDSINWKTTNDGLELFVNSHADANQSRYYIYDYEETYEYSSVFASSYKFSGGVPVYRLPEEQIFRCWRSNTSNSILLTSTETLDENVVSEFPILHIAKNDRRLWKKYSLLIHQKSLTKEAYNFWVQLRKTNESLGGLFDPIPYQIKGNIFAESNADEIVLGFFTAGEIESKRITISNGVLPIGFGGSNTANCTEAFVAVDKVNTLSPSSAIITTAVYSGIVIIGYNYSTPSCVDCRLSGGTTTKPDFM